MKESFISDCGFRIFWFSFSIRNPQSAFRNLVSRLDTRPGLWNIDSNDLMTDGRVHKDFPDAFGTWMFHWERQGVEDEEIR